MTIEEFIDLSRKKRWPSREWLLEPEWERLYVRLSILVVFDAQHVTIDLNEVLHLASFEARVHRDGAFTRLIQRIEAHAPGLPIFIENLMNQEFAAKLPELGWTEVFTCTPEMRGHVGSQCFLKGHNGNV